MNLAEYLELLGITADEFVGLLWKRGDSRSTAVLPPSMVPAIADYQIPRDHDAYLAPNPTAGPLRMNQGRGTEEQVTRVAALYADLDVKPGACADLDAAQDIVGDMAGLLDERPACVIFSGGGLQPIWLLENCNPIVGRALLRRFGRLTRVVGQARNAQLDSVFDTARVLRIPGTLNHKYGVPIEVLIIPDTGSAMDPQAVSEKLDEAGIFAEDDDDSSVGRPDVVVAEADWLYAVSSCGYSVTTIAGWLTEAVVARHPWYLGVSIRLECMRRNGCLSATDYTAARRNLQARFVNLLNSQAPQRKPVRYEISDILNEAVQKASRKSADELGRELGPRGGTGHAHLLGTPPPAVGGDKAVAGDLAPVAGTLVELEQAFWEQRESLKQIYNAALARMCSPWAVLACCVARALALVRPNATLPALVGGKGSLNWFGAVAAQSGGGKGSSLAVARDLVGESVYQRNLGSGEGMVTAFKCRTSDDNPDGTRESVMFVADEIDNVSALGARTGSTLLPTLRSAFSAEALGFSYATKGRDVHLPAHSYRLTLVCAIQPGRAGALLDDDAGGTPQRFMWFPGTDERITRNQLQQYDRQFGLTLPGPREWRYPREIILPNEATNFILDERVAAMKGDTAALDGHAVFAREKFAYALTVLDGRTQMTSQDWALSGIAADVSRATRERIAGERILIDRRDAERRGEIRGVELSAADDAKLGRASARSDRIANWIVERLNATNGEGVTNRDLARAIASRDRPYLDAILTHLVGQGVVVAGIGPAGGNVWRKA